MMRTVVFTAALLWAEAAGAAGWRPALPLNMPERSPAQTVLMLIDAITAGDETAMLQLIWASERGGQMERRRLLARLIAARVALQKAAEEKFGEAGRALSCGFETVFPPAVRANFEQAEVVLLQAGHGALVIPAGGGEPVRLRRSVRGAWQVVLPEMEMEREGVGDELDAARDESARWPVARYRALLRAVQQARAGILAGTAPAFASAESAQAWLADRLAEIQRTTFERRAAPGDQTAPPESGGVESPESSGY